MNARYVPNIISVVRILLVIPVVVLLARREFGLALTLFAVAGVSDAVDGYLARTYGWQTSLGGWLDPVADKTMMVSVYLMLAWIGLIPLWLFLAVVLRDVIIASGSLIYYYWVEKVEAEPSWISKLNTLVQIILVMIVVVDQIIALPAYIIDGLIFSALATTMLSGIGYVWVWGLRALALKRDEA